MTILLSVLAGIVIGSVGTFYFMRRSIIPGVIGKFEREGRITINK